MAFRNKYAGTCATCGQQVRPGDGFTRRGGDGEPKWVTTHDTCPTTAPESRAQPSDTTLDFTPTPEQERCVELFATGDDLVIQAGAGAGKTSTLMLLANQALAVGRRGQYCAYNRAIVSDIAGKAPGNINASTMHSLAFRAVGYQFKQRLDSSRQRGDEVARRLGLGSFNVKVGRESKTLAAGWLASKVLAAVANFCRSTDREVEEKHFAYVDGIDMPDLGGRPTRRNNDALARHLLPYARKAWEDLSDPNGRLRYSHDCYLKTWALGDPVIEADFVLLDEAQDADPVQAQIVKAQHRHGTQTVVVGDSAQCQPQGTMVTVVDQYRRGNRHSGVDPTSYRTVPIEEIVPGDVVLSYSIAKSYLRRQGSEVKGVAVRPYEGQLVEVEAAENRSSYTPDHRCVVRVGDALSEKWVVYLMRRGQSFRVGMVAGVYGSQGGDLGLPKRLRTEHADAAWVLSVHDTKAEARVAEALTAWSYGIPSLRFVQGDRDGITQAELDSFWAKVGDLTHPAERVLTDHGRQIAHPICEPGRRLYRNRGQVMVAANLIDGMLMLPSEGAFAAGGKRAGKNRWAPITVRHRWYTGPVYSLDVERDQTYVADGIVTHNCIYEWRGAVDALADFEAMGAQVAWLSQSFRFGDAIADAANGLLDRLNAPLRVRGFGPVTSTVGPVDEPDAILCRSNAGTIRALLNEHSAGRSVHLVGNGSEALAFTRAAVDLMEGRSTNHPDLACFSTWAQVQDYVEHDEMGGELRLMVNLIEDFGAQTIIDALDKAVPEGRADVVISTAHKSKGREWSRVQISGDFPPPKPNESGKTELSTAELRLAYVAVTRAKHALDLSAVPHFQNQSAGSEPEEEN